MATYTDTLGYNRGTAAFNNRIENRFVFLDTVLDFAKIKTARTNASATALAAADTMQVLPLHAGLVILQGGIEVVTAETTNTTATFDIGFLGGSPAAANVFGDDVASNAAAITATGLAAPLLITAADTLDVLLNTAVPQNAVVRIWVAGFNANKLDG